jgi:hypothetical protein
MELPPAQQGEPPAQPPEQPEEFPFALTPAIAIEGIVNFATRGGVRLYTSASQKLEEDQYDCKPEGLYQFLQSLTSRAHEFGWDDELGGILMIPGDPNDPLTDLENLIENYGQISLERIRAFEESYLDTACRPAQDSFMMYKCLMNSITKEGKDKVTIWKESYMVGNQPSGNLLLKIIIRESHLDTNATTSTIRTKLSNLDKYILTIGCDITKFNGHVKYLVDNLAARGETTNDLLEFLFKGYGVVADTDFRNYIKRKLENYEEGDNTTPETLMLLANNKFKLSSENGTWLAPSKGEEKILALEAQLRAHKKGPNAKQKGKESQKTQASTGNKPKGTKASKPEWFDKPPPKAAMTTPKYWKEKPWYWCSSDTGGQCEGAWRCHKPSECQGKAFRFKRDEEDPARNKRKTEKTGNNNKRKLKLTKAMSAAVTTRDSESTDSQEEPVYPP